MSVEVVVSEKYLSLSSPQLISSSSGVTATSPQSNEEAGGSSPLSPLPVSWLPASSSAEISTPNEASSAFARSGQLTEPGIKIKVMFGPKLLKDGLLDQSERLEEQTLKT